MSEKSIQTERADKNTTPTSADAYPLLQLSVSRSIAEKQVVLPAATVITSVLQHQKKNPDPGDLFYLAGF